MATEALNVSRRNEQVGVELCAEFIALRISIALGNKKRVREISRRLDALQTAVHILYGWKPDAGHNFYGGRRQSTVIPSLFPVTVTEDADGKKLVTFNFGIGQVVLKVPEYIVVDTEDAATVVHVEKPARNGEHPTMKPLALCAKFIANSSLEGQSVIDLFGGSGRFYQT